jgi:hypothetical protein
MTCQLIKNINRSVEELMYMKNVENNEWVDAIFNDTLIDDISLVDINTYYQYGVVSDIYSKDINVIVDSQDIYHQIKDQEELRAELYETLRKDEFKKISDGMMKFKFYVSKKDSVKIKKKIDDYNSMINGKYEPIDIYNAVTLPAITFKSKDENGKNIVHEYKPKEVLCIVEGEYNSRYSDSSMFSKLFSRNQMELDQQLKNVFINFINYIESLPK